MELYQERVKEELAELNEKLEKLKNFLESDKIEKVEKDERLRLMRQFRAMGNYALILMERIEAFKETKNRD